MRSTHLVYAAVYKQLLRPCLALLHLMASVHMKISLSVPHPLQLAKAVLQLEAALRPVALAPEWRAGTGGVVTTAGGRTPSTSRAVSRATSVADLAAAGAHIPPPAVSSS